MMELRREGWRYFADFWNYMQCGSIVMNLTIMIIDWIMKT